MSPSPLSFYCTSNSFSFCLCFQIIRLSSFARPRSNLKLSVCCPIGWPNSPSPSFVLLTGGPHLSSLPFWSDPSKTRVWALARLPCLCPAHAAWPQRPCARSPSHDVRCPSNLPAHHSPLSRSQSGSVCQDRLPRLAHMTNLDRAVWRYICPAPSHICSLVFEPVSSMHPVVLLPFHRHANVVCPLSPLANAPHSLVPMHCACAHAACTRALRRAYFPVPMRR
jgi:hypothetical protein